MIHPSQTAIILSNQDDRPKKKKFDFWVIFGPSHPDIILGDDSVTTNHHPGIILGLKFARQSSCPGLINFDGIIL